MLLASFKGTIQLSYVETVTKLLTKNLRHKINRFQFQGTVPRRTKPVRAMVRKTSNKNFKNINLKRLRGSFLFI